MFSGLIFWGRAWSSGGFPKRFSRCRAQCAPTLSRSCDDFLPPASRRCHGWRKDRLSLWCGRRFVVWKAVWRRAAQAGCRERLDAGNSWCLEGPVLRNCHDLRNCHEFDGRPPHHGTGFRTKLIHLMFDFAASGLRFQVGVVACWCPLFMRLRPPEPFVPASHRSRLSRRGGPLSSRPSFPWHCRPVLPKAHRHTKASTAKRRLWRLATARQATAWQDRRPIWRGAMLRHRPCPGR